MRVLQRMRQAIREQRYRVSSHANEEMSEDEPVAEDIESIILTGQIARKLTRDPRGTRYEVAGDTTDGRRACVVCCFLPSSVLLIITTSVEEE
ncbi:MAG: DUF4258 domain-containing protein [Ardenticatenaceae bacterium]|nr:DUF4258 domain-containing protein [Ardenticatenaceae bacterium]